MSQHLDSLQIGDTMPVRGPDGKVEYLGAGEHRHGMILVLIRERLVFLRGGMIR